MTAVKDIRETPIAPVPPSPEARREALERAVEHLAACGWRPETKPDNVRVLVGHNEFRRLLVQRQWGLRNRRELVEVDKDGEIATRPV